MTTETAPKVTVVLDPLAYAYLLELVQADANRIRREADHAASHGEYRFIHPSAAVSVATVKAVLGATTTNPRAVNA